MFYIILIGESGHESHAKPGHARTDTMGLHLGRSMTHYGIQAGTTRQPTGQAGRVKIGVLPTCPFSTFHLASPAIVRGRKTNRVRHLHGYIKAVSQLVSCRRKKQTP
jgi:hypothetical protein